MLVNYNTPPIFLFMSPRVEGVVQHLDFQVFICVLNLFVQHGHPNS